MACGEGFLERFQWVKALFGSGRIGILSPSSRKNRIVCKLSVKSVLILPVWL